MPPMPDDQTTLLAMSPPDDSRLREAADAILDYIAQPARVAAE